MDIGPPKHELPVPAAVARLAGGHAIRPVWTNGVDSTTFEISVDGGRWFAKWVASTSTINLETEAERLAWAVRYITVPRVREVGKDDEGSWMVTDGLPGENAIHDRWKAEPATAVAVIGSGLRQLHDALPVDECPFSWSVDTRMAGNLHLEVEEWAEEHRPLGAERALEILADPPSVDQLVVCHGDPCSPNTLITDDGRLSGHVDMGWLGVADRWSDLAVATWSSVWNYGPGWEDHLLDAYGIDADPERTTYYRLLWEVCD
jgi:kanamycin kinase